MTFIQKQRNILDVALCSLLRRKGKNLSLVAAYVFVIFLLSSVMFITDALKREASFVLKDTPEMVVQRLVAGRHELVPTAYAKVIGKIKGVQSVSARLWGYYYDATNGANYTLIVHQDLITSPGSIMVGRGVARHLSAGENGTIPFKACDGSYLFLEIRSVLPSESELVSADLVLMSELDFRRLFQMPEGYATDLVLRVRNVRELSTIAAKVVQLLPDTRPVSRDEILRTYDAVFSWRSGLVIVIFAGALCAFLILAWDKATGLSAEEKREIGLLKAVGWETSDVLLMKFWEGMAVSLVSFLTGIILAYVHIFFTSASLFKPALKGWAVLYPDFRLTPFIDGQHAATLFFLTVVPYTAATIVPSWRTATMDPDSVMRS